MVARNELLGAFEEAQSEFVDTLQVTATEEEAHELVQRHIERCLPDTTAVVLTRNNSDNRLRAATALAPGNELVDRLAGAEPRACLALRFSRTHCEGTERPPLLSCGLCGDRDTRSTCEPLLVGGEVIGSVLVTHRQLLDEDEAGRIKSSVGQAAPVLANLRNLALAEFRANSDALTGLPNKRATEDTLKRMVAQANRSITPLTAAVLDLDHFKQINDRYGHGKGDEMLAAVGVALRSSLRASDFVGRYGGEEFLILLPETTTDGGMQVAEKIRNAIAAITIPGVDRDITASIGLADLLDQAGDATGLVREADRAMYAAKTAGRNCTLVAASDTDEELTGLAT
jgi:diguanylate cyclase (GGDEF)-like protein